MPAVPGGKAVGRRTSAATRWETRHVEAEVHRLHAHVPEEMRLKRVALAAEERRIANFIDFIADGKGTSALADALTPCRSDRR